MTKFKVFLYLSMAIQAFLIGTVVNALMQGAILLGLPLILLNVIGGVLSWNILKSYYTPVTVYTEVPVNKLPLWAIHIIKDRATSDHVFLYVMENNISVLGVMVWEDTPEGVAVWEQVDNGNVRPLAKFHRVNPKTGRHIILSPIKFIRVIQNILLYGTV